jgi:hypothetical protein
MHLVDNLQACKPNPEFPKKEEHFNFIVTLFNILINSSCAIYSMSVHHTLHVIWQTQRFCPTHPCKIFRALLSIKEYKCCFCKKVSAHTCTSFVFFKAAETGKMLSISPLHLVFTSTNSVWFRMIWFYHVAEKHSIHWTLHTYLPCVLFNLDEQSF